METKEKVDVYELVTNRIIKQLEFKVIPWQQPWTEAGLPQNLVTGRYYRGINVWLLSSLGYPTNYFLSFKQIKDLGGSVKKGEKSYPVIFWKWLNQTDEETGEETKNTLLRYYNVFNIDQCEGIPEDRIPTPEVNQNDPLEVCEEIVAKMPQRPEFKQAKEAYYNPLLDIVYMPKLESFVDSESYYNTLFHELVHSTGHFKRLNRKGIIERVRFGSEPYANEELVAEIGACFLKSFAGIAKVTTENNVAYIQGWLEKLRNDKCFIIHASAQAQKAADFILNKEQPEKEEEVTEVED